MREVKFRAWDKYTRKMIEIGFHLIGECTMFQCIESYLDEHPNPKLSSSLLRLNDIELMQYTGLKDKNGVEIYEGDIVEYRYSDMSGGRAEVIYKDGCFETGCGYVSSLAAMHKLEVIGNIYENPELLKKEG